MPGSDPVVCPSCLTPHTADERFCVHCSMPLVHPEALEGDLAVSDAHARARKIKPQLSEGELVKVAGGRNQTEAEFIQGLLLEEGVPSMLRRARGFDVPDMLAAGPRDVLVPRSGVQTAREVLLQAELLETSGATGVDPPGRVMGVLLVVVVLVALIAWIGTELLL